ncbi:MazG family protein [Dermatophilus congolensis]|uniref:MazG family protein n=1 Tax=Dermatophilus congolensis TaxID=1863 RepID=UPI001AAFD21A|nr:MazG family protein [Dermatophilus congolensis]MBO3143275.1 MazG family protein [Dermatophilus congolensis]MBO3152262.1 MazG family protein [Dermatophilus congolensis]MBO3160726.1 MazG family protein [Dermatophilus congolensis]MBO3163550.1 MazG family protein [Dermatophilus congolensis]MBO3177096.1 MazG family protein [Dermatophilus congolensis]
MGSTSSSQQHPTDAEQLTGITGLIEVMDRLRSPGGCPWDAAQTHNSLAKFAVEEAYELADAIDSGDREELVDELGDVLFQVVFHARLGHEHDQPFTIDDIAERTIAKLRRRHPHVFGDVDTDDPARIEANWDAIKAAEKPERRSPLDGIPASLAPLERAAKIANRHRRAGHLNTVRSALADQPEDDYGTRLFALVLEAVDAGVDPGTALLATVNRVTTSLRDRQEQGPSDPLESTDTD